MKLAVVSPTQTLWAVEEIGLGYHLAEATKLLTDDIYLRFYERMGKRGHFIIVDSGAAEAVKVNHGHAMDVDGVQDVQEMPYFPEVVKVAEKVSASEIILPDRKMDAEWTVESARGWAYLVPDYKRAVVPQGRTWDEWERCLKMLPYSATVCLTKDYEELEGGRLHALEILSHSRILNVHLLGLKNMSWGPKVEVQRLVTKYPWVRGLDTGAPIAWAQHDVDITKVTANFSLDWDKYISTKEQDLVYNNIRALMRWCNGDFK